MEQFKRAVAARAKEFSALQSNPLSTEKKFYVYVLMDPTRKGKTYDFDGKELAFKHEPFYIGKGHGRRMHDHLKAALGSNPDKRSHKENRIRKIVAAGKTPIVKQLSALSTEAVALVKEVMLIEKIGLRSEGKGPLTNRSYGGDGHSGHKVSEATKAKMRGREVKAETREKLRQINLGKTHTAEARAKLSKAFKGVAKSAKHRQRISDALKGKTRTAEHSKAISESRKGLKHSEETKAKMSAARTGKVHSEESKQKRREALQGIAHTIIKCPHCKTKGGRSIMKRWHFDNCRER